MTDTAPQSGAAAVVPEPPVFSVSKATKGERRVMLVSNATMKGDTFLSHCIDALIGHYKGVKKLLFIGYGENDFVSYTNKVRAVFAQFGIEVEGIHEPALESPTQTPREVLLKAEAVLVGGGNAYLLQANISNLYRLMGARVWAGMPYAAFGAGVTVSGLSMQLTTDMPLVLPTTLRGMGVVPFNLHIVYQDRNPNDTSNKPTIAQQIEVYHDRSQTVVVALRDGAFLRAVGDSCILGGSSAGARMFLRKTDAIEYAKGSDLSFLILQNPSENLDFKVTVEDKATEAAEKLHRQALSAKKKALNTQTGQRMAKSIDEGTQALNVAGKKFQSWSTNMFNKIKNDMSGANSYLPDDDDEEPQPARM